MYSIPATGKRYILYPKRAQNVELVSSAMPARVATSPPIGETIVRPIISHVINADLSGSLRPSAARQAGRRYTSADANTRRVQEFGNGQLIAGDRNDE